MSKTQMEQHLERMVTAEPDNENSAGALETFYREALGHTEEEASVKRHLLQLLAKRNQRYERALELLSGNNPDLGELIQKILTEVSSVEGQNVKFDVVRGMIAPHVPSITDKPDKQPGVPVVRVGADYVLQAAGALNEKPTKKKKKPE